MFTIGNVVRLPHDGSLYVVVGERHLIPFDYCNVSVHPPEEDRYGTREVMDDDGNVTEQTVLFAHSIDRYKLVARTIDDFIVGRLRLAMYGT